MHGFGIMLGHSSSGGWVNTNLLVRVFFFWQLGFVQFESVMKVQIKLYVQRQLSNALISGTANRNEVLRS